jgi:hypothetical protein
MTKTERQKLLDYMDKNNTITTNELWENIADIIRTYALEPLDANTYVTMQNQVNEYFLYLEREKIKAFSEGHNSFIVGAILRFTGPSQIKIAWVLPDGSTIE